MWNELNNYNIIAEINHKIIITTWTIIEQIKWEL